MEVRKFLVLGIGNAQVDLLQYLQRLTNIEIHALSNTEYGRGKHLVDKFEVIDITDKQNVFNYVVHNKIDYIYSIGSDAAMPTVAWVAEKTGLKSFISYESAYLCNNKHLFRERLKNTYGSVPYEVLDEDLTLERFSLPAIVKPVDSQGQRGITIIHNKQELEKAYKAAICNSRKNKAIIEKEIKGPEISLHCYLKNGEIKFFLPSDRITWPDFDGGLIHKHKIPSSINNSVYYNLRRLVSDVTSTLNIKNGPVYFQIKISGDKPFLIEVTPRLDGCHMWRQIFKSTGIDLLDITIRDLMGQPFSIANDYKIVPSTLEFFCQAPGERFEEQKVSENACFFESYYRKGDIVKPMNMKYEKCGYQIILERDE